MLTRQPDLLLQREHKATKIKTKSTARTNKNPAIRYVRISSNTTKCKWYVLVLYVRHNYMFRPQILAIFRLYNENLSIGYSLHM
jgi:hypothetical protein